MNNKDVYANLDQLIDRLDSRQLNQLLSQVLKVGHTSQTWQGQATARRRGYLYSQAKGRFTGSSDLMQAFDTGSN